MTDEKQPLKLEDLMQVPGMDRAELSKVIKRHTQDTFDIVLQVLQSQLDLSTPSLMDQAKEHGKVVNEFHKGVLSCIAAVNNLKDIHAKVNDLG